MWATQLNVSLTSRADARLEYDISQSAIWVTEWNVSLTSRASKCPVNWLCSHPVFAHSAISPFLSGTLACDIHIVISHIWVRNSYVWHELMRDAYVTPLAHCDTWMSRCICVELSMCDMIHSYVTCMRVWEAHSYVTVWEGGDEWMTQSVRDPLMWLVWEWLVWECERPSHTLIQVTYDWIISHIWMRHSYVPLTLSHSHTITCKSTQHLVYESHRNESCHASAYVMSPCISLDVTFYICYNTFYMCYNTFYMCYNTLYMSCHAVYVLMSRCICVELCIIIWVSEIHKSAPVV